MTDAQPLVLTAALLDALDPLTHPQRMRELASRARCLADEGLLRPVLDELADGDPYERRTAVVAAAVGQDAEWTGAHLTDEDGVVRGHALRAARSLGVPDRVYEEAFADAPAVVRRQLVRAIVLDGRTALADRLLHVLRATWGDTEAARLLPGCSAGTVEEALPALLRSVGGWSSLGHHHPGPLLDAAEAELAALPGAERHGWWHGCGHGRAVAAAASALPHRVLDLLERYGPARLPGSLFRHLGHLATADPARFARLLLAPGTCVIPGHALSRSLLHRLVGALPDGLVAELGRSSPDLLPRLLRALPPSRRTAVHAAAVAGQGEGAHVTVDTALLDALPRTHVADVARRLADRARARGADRTTVLRAESYLPFDEVRDRLLAATREPVADDRATAWSLLVRNAGRSGDRETVATVLEDLLRLRNEQDPVRSTALRALLTVPPALFTDTVEPLLDRIAADAVEARDSSATTRTALSSLAVAVLREHAVTGERALLNWALRTLVRISGNSGSADLGRLDRTLRRGQEHTVLEVLRPWLEAGAERSDYGLVLALARALGRRADALPGLQELLWQAISYGSTSTARSAVELWLRDPADRDARIERLLTRDPSAAALPAVQRVLTTRRTDLLDAYLGGTPPWGRFLTPRHGVDHRHRLRRDPLGSAPAARGAAGVGAHGGGRKAAAVRARGGARPARRAPGPGLRRRTGLGGRPGRGAGGSGAGGPRAHRPPCRRPARPARPRRGRPGPRRAVRGGPGRRPRPPLPAPRAVRRPHRTRHRQGDQPQADGPAGRHPAAPARRGGPPRRRVRTAGPAPRCAGRLCGLRYGAAR
ncbi:hypothetical protein ACG93S_08190 [Streptomyces sp. WAC01490]|uniref:hypothetical protein n=1 Tax=unclassified Streptomyces TaxID=2593676 RepID=UPI003F3E944E